jgi:hypothetical protein
MAPNSTTPSAPAEAFAPPPSAAELHQSRKEVSWSATPKETDEETIEKRKMLITYSIVANLSLITVLKTTLNILQATDPSFILISNVDSTVTLRNAADAEKIQYRTLKNFSRQRYRATKFTARSSFSQQCQSTHSRNQRSDFTNGQAVRCGSSNHTQPTLEILGSLFTEIPRKLTGTHIRRKWHSN